MSINRHKNASMRSLKTHGLPQNSTKPDRNSKEELKIETSKKHKNCKYVNQLTQKRINEVIKTHGLPFMINLGHGSMSAK